MKKLTSLAAALCMCGWMVGCAPEAPTETAPAASSEEHGESAEHSHEEGEDHDHAEGEAEGGEEAAPAETPEAGSAT